ncbi:hypothetical protein CDL12_17831 [Handroanthus impetiginosus]|uniref:NAC domain-containing protein n=1 Tax=Handroanthus impetiginosus TaxID=429701 RepID=A0A2G9GWG1_9LAMI|nr:hypothetical protein CDL12_17831 [Handroanthus impetiginosus]
MGIRGADPNSQLSLPPGFRFHPTDEELLVQYLCRKVAGHHFSLEIIGDVDLYKFDAWDLPKKALFGEKEWYFFSPRDRKYPNGSRPNRVAGSGYWKATGTDKIITTVDGRKVGIKKALVFYVGKAPKGTKTNWIMHEYRLYESPRMNQSKRLDDWVLCRIYERNSNGPKPNISGSSSPCSSQYDDVMETLPEIGNTFSSSPQINSLNKLDEEKDQKLNLDWTTLAGLGPIWPEDARAQNMGLRNNVCAPASVGDNKVHSGPGLFRQDITGSGQGFPGLVDPLGVLYPVQPGGPGYIASEKVNVLGVNL